MGKLLSIALSTIMMASIGSCELINKQEKKYDYSGTELIIEERDQFAPCYAQELFAGNEHTNEYFYLLFSSARVTDSYTLTVNDEVWTFWDRHERLLPEGEYDIVIETVEGLTMPIKTPMGVVEAPYQKKLTLPVSVSIEYENKYNIRR